MWIKENVILTNVKKIYRTGFGINIEFENNFSAECPELKDKIFWEFIDNCISKDLTPLRLELVSYNLINKALFNFARYQNESDILLITEKGHFLFEIKTDINRLDENIYYKLLRIANLLGIKNNRVFLVIVDLEISDNNEHLTEPENKEENILRTLIQEFEGINVCSIKETKNLLKREFYKMLIEK